jgi:hypothetical protein
VLFLDGSSRKSRVAKESQRKTSNLDTHHLVACYGCLALTSDAREQRRNMANANKVTCESRNENAYERLCQVAFRGPSATFEDAEAYRIRSQAGASDPQKVVLCRGVYFVVPVWF